MGGHGGDSGVAGIQLGTFGCLVYKWSNHSGLELETTVKNPTGRLLYKDYPEFWQLLEAAGADFNQIILEWGIPSVSAPYLRVYGAIQSEEGKNKYVAQVSFYEGHYYLVKLISDDHLRTFLGIYGPLVKIGMEIGMQQLRYDHAKLMNSEFRSRSRNNKTEFLNMFDQLEPS